MDKLIKSISGIRGKIDNLDDYNTLNREIQLAIYGFIKILKIPIEQKESKKFSIIIGRDGRKTGEKIKESILEVLSVKDIDIIDIGFATTPTIAFLIKDLKLSGGIMITASHNSIEWNGIKLYNSSGENLSQDEWKRIEANVSSKLNLLNSYLGESTNIVSSNPGVSHIENDNEFKYLEEHIKKIIGLDIIDSKSIKNRKFKIAFDGCNSTGIEAMKILSKYLDLEVEYLNSHIDGAFSRNPEPVSENLYDIKMHLKEKDFDIGFAVDPDVDRLIIIDEKGEIWGEEFTLICAADYVLSKEKGPAVSNLSSSRGLEIVSKKHQCEYYSSPVGEVNVIREMKKVDAVIGGEGNGGVIYPKLSYSRDAMFGIAVILSLLNKNRKLCSQILDEYPKLVIKKEKISLPEMDFENLLGQLKSIYKRHKLDLRDGLRIDFPKGWIHIRKSNTEPIIRIIAESENEEGVRKLISDFKVYLDDLL